MAREMATNLYVRGRTMQDRLQKFNEEKGGDHDVIMIRKTVAGRGEGTKEVTGADFLAKGIGGLNLYSNEFVESMMAQNNWRR
jgi:hypothetical protein